MKIYIRGFAEMQREVERTLSAHTGEVIEHMLKCYLMPDHPAVNHWKSEIANQLNHVDKLKSSKKYPISSQIYNWTYGNNKHMITDLAQFADLVGIICSDYSIELNISYEELADTFDSICKEYFSWLAEKLNKTGTIKNSDIYRKLDELL